MIPPSILKWRDLAEQARVFGLNPNLILAVIEQESGGNPWAWKPEGHYRYFWNVRTGKPFREPTRAEIDSKIPPGDFPFLAGSRVQEWWGQQVSWGLMQVMGAAARERGFRGPYLPEILDPEKNLFFGLKHLWEYAFQKGKRSTEEALLRYNGGGNPNYPDEVLTKLTNMEREL